MVQSIYGLAFLVFVVNNNNTTAFESRENETVRVAILCLAVCDLVNMASMYGTGASYIMSPPPPTPTAAPPSALPSLVKSH